jgi:drug/metabolite transporter (DMT)-like permease
MAITTRTLAGRVPAAQVSLVRFVVGLSGAGVLFLARRRGPDLRRWGLLVLRGGFGGAAVLTYFLAIERLGAAAGTVLNYTAPVFASVFAHLFLGERSAWTARSGLVLATLGAALVAFSSASASPLATPVVGVLAGLSAPVFGGAALTAMKKVRDDTDALSVFFALCAVGLVLSLPFAVNSWVPIDETTLVPLLAIGGLGLLGQLLLTWGMGHTTATAGSATTQLVPAFAWVLALGWLHEAVQPLAVLGAALCVSGVVGGVIPWRRLRAASSG